MAVDIDEILALPLEERRELAELLLHSIDAESGDVELSPEQWAEVEKALEEHERHPGDGIEAFGFIESLRRRRP